ncbi:septum formation initiator family protein [Gramella sp. BOM4]|uniref:Septum formation initiator family protein n=1 Tax=Christiangramia oceanisediminis TaxID=2920386 RepID=A0A9X2KYT8_9FLAO|nr:septum formation initiator family protein [Gramella oceanisediminis]MCP9200893.1 septum formation initiator family protein [Gramella oceanisediminis]MUP46108.1 septum formation initiator family protein [Christiangramia bathymodioli]
MKFKDLRNKSWFRIISNKYVLISLVFAGWMIFLDTNSWFIHHELDQELNELQDNKNYYQKEIAKDKAVIQQLQDSVELEKFARQKYYMKRPNEEIYIIEYDTVD